MYKAEVLIMEITFLQPEHRKDKIHKMGHIHLDDVIARRDKFENELIIASHFSTRYNARQIRRLVDQYLPDKLDGRLEVWV